MTAEKKDAYQIISLNSLSGSESFRTHKGCKVHTRQNGRNGTPIMTTNKQSHRKQVCEHLGGTTTGEPEQVHPAHHGGVPRSFETVETNRFWERPKGVWSMPAARNFLNFNGKGGQ